MINYAKAHGNPWQRLPNDLYPRTRTGFSLSLRTVCGGYVTSSRGHLTSPNYPQPFPANTECQWVVSMSPATLIQFQFTDLDLGMSETLTYDPLTQ